MRYIPSQRTAEQREADRKAEARWISTHRDPRTLTDADPMPGPRSAAAAPSAH